MHPKTFLLLSVLKNVLNKYFFLSVFSSLASKTVKVGVKKSHFSSQVSEDLKKKDEKEKVADGKIKLPHERQIQVDEYVSNDQDEMCQTTNKCTL